MLKRILTILLSLIIFSASSSYATYDPLSVPNNRIGVHILEPSEIFQASQLVNSNGGDWGYVTIPIRSNDRDYLKWKEFFDKALQLHIIPIIRLATYPSDDKWVSPTEFDIIDFVNFLNLFKWPTQNRYVIFFNEPNHSKEWGGEINPEHYTSLAKFFHETFKQASPDYFLISAGLDMSAPSNHTSLDALQYYRRMFSFDSQWPNYFDGIGLHPYPNPAFKASAFSSNRYGIRSFEYELNLLAKYGFRPKHLFFTETGTVNSSKFYTSALTSVWRDTRIVAITPFVLYAGAGDFKNFSLLSSDHGQTENYREIKNLPKIMGQPIISTASANLAVATHPPQSPPQQNPVRSIWRAIVDYLTLNP